MSASPTQNTNKKYHGITESIEHNDIINKQKQHKHNDHGSVHTITTNLFCLSKASILHEILCA